MTTPDLKPCPFCGGIAYLRDDVSHSTAYFIGCATEDCFGEFHWGQTADETVKAWNTRAPMDGAVKALVEAAQVCVDTFRSTEHEKLHAALAKARGEA